MKIVSHQRSLFLLLALCLCLAGATAADQKVAISFDEYHGYTKTVQYIKKVARAYPAITELLETGQSTTGRPIYVLVISNMNTGTTIDAHVPLRNMRKEGVKNVTPMKPYQGKAAQWIDGGMHGNEYTGTEVCLYIINKLVSGYGSDQEITKLIDTKTFYICPVTNPDGVYNSVEKGIAQRQNSMMEDDDDDGKINEDSRDDLNRDGEITQFRYKDDKGNYVIDDVDPRLMVRLGRDEETSKQRYSVITEDKDNDGDGRRGEDGERGIDVNRNFPQGWFGEDGIPGGSGYYPTSSPEARSLVEFFVNHRNILMAQNFHTSGGFTYRPPGTDKPEAMHKKDVAVYDFILGKKYLEIIGLEVPRAWQQPDSLDKFKAQLRRSQNKYAAERGYEMPRGWINSYNEERDRIYGHGMVIDWMYQQYGAYSTTTELWNRGRDIPGMPEFSGEDARLQQERFLLQYNDEKYDGDLFIPWKKYTHPELGEGEIGGWKSQYSRNNAFPGEPLLHVCEMHWQFELFRAGLLPEVEITKAEAKLLYTTDNAYDAAATQQGDRISIKKGGRKGSYKIIEVTATIENTGKLATHVARGAGLAGNREDAVWLIGDRDKITYLHGSAFQRIGVLEGTMKIPGYSEQRTSGSSSTVTRAGARRPGGTPYSMPPNMPSPIQRGQEVSRGERESGPTREVVWLIAVEGDSPLKVVVTSQKGGTKVKTLSIR